MAKLYKFAEGSDWLYAFHCPGCGYGHSYDKRWKFNGDMDKPTFTPSLLVNAKIHEQYPIYPRCHLYLTNGKLQFLSDCTHALAGQTVDLPDIP